MAKHEAPGADLVAEEERAALVADVTRKMIAANEARFSSLQAQIDQLAAEFREQREWHGLASIESARSRGRQGA